MGLSTSHIRFEQLVDLAEGRLSPEEAAQIETRLATDAASASEFAFIKRTLALMRADDGADAPPDLIARAVRLFRPASAPERRPSIREHIIATLAFDSGAMPLAFGVRGAPPEARQMLFTADDYELDIRISPNAHGWQVAGQVLGLPPESRVLGFVQMQDAQSLSFQADINALGEFTLPPTSAGQYALLVRVTTDDAPVEIEISQLRLGS